MGARSSEKWLAPFSFSLVANAVWLEVLEFMAGVALRHPIGNIKSKLGVRRKREFVMSAKIATPFVAAFSASEVITCKNGKTPLLVSNSPTVVECPLRAAMRECVMRRTARRPHANYRADFRAGGFRHWATLPWRGLAFVRARSEFDVGGGMLELHDKKGGDMSEWDEDLRVREFPGTKMTEGTKRTVTAR